FRLEGLDPLSTAEVLLRIGALTGWIGDARQLNGSQEMAKNLITRSMDVFERLGQPSRLAEARGDLALCYCREGAFDDARVTLATALACLGNEDVCLRAILLIRAGNVELQSQQLGEAFRFFSEAQHLVEHADNDALKGSFHMHRAVLFRRMAKPEKCDNYI